jgi:hypothetical protein
MTAAEKLEAKMTSQTDAQLTGIYKDTLRMRHGDTPKIGLMEELGIVMRFAEQEMDRRGLDVDGIITEVLGR